MEREQNTASIPMLQKLGVIVESDLVQKIIIGLILLNAVTLGLETNSVLMKEYGQQISFFIELHDWFDIFFICIISFYSNVVIVISSFF